MNTYIKCPLSVALAYIFLVFLTACGPEHIIVGRGASVLSSGNKLKTQSKQSWGGAVSVDPDLFLPYPIHIEIEGLGNGLQRVSGYSGISIFCDLQKQIIGKPDESPDQRFAMAFDIGGSFSYVFFSAHVGLIVSHPIGGKTAYVAYRKYFSYVNSAISRDFLYLGYEYSPSRTIELYYAWTLYAEVTESDSRKTLGVNIISWQF